MKNVIYDMEIVSKQVLGKEPCDVFLLAGGSDYRAYEVLRKMKSAGVSIDRVLLFQFVERVEDIDDADPYYQYQQLGFDIEPISCFIKEPGSCLESLVSSGIESMSSLKIALDISCFTKPYFFYLMKLFKERSRIDCMRVFYTEPQSYLFPQGIFTSYHSSTGPLTILEIPGFSGHEVIGQERVLVILLGFDGDLSREIGEDISPFRTLAVNGFPSYSPKFKDISLVANEKLTSNRDIKIRFSSANNPFDVFNLLENIKEQNANSFINIVPLGTKPMALGACLFALHNPEVRIVYPFPEIYEKITTDKCWNSWSYVIPLSDLS